VNRRNFLAALAAAALDPERLLWLPGTKLISIPRPGRVINVTKPMRFAVVWPPALWMVEVVQVADVRAPLRAPYQNIRSLR
jgi:hypothetical protein